MPHSEGKYGVPQRLSNGRWNPRYEEARRRARGVRPRPPSKYGVPATLSDGSSNPKYYEAIRRARGVAPRSPNWGNTYGISKRLPDGTVNPEYQTALRRAKGIKPQKSAGDNMYGVPRNLPDGRSNPAYWAAVVHKQPERVWARRTLSTHKSAGFNVNISLDWLEMFAKNIRTCPIHDDLLYYGQGRKTPKLTPSLDRINNENILRASNVWIICNRSNLMKLNMGLVEWLDFCSKVTSSKEKIIEQLSLQTDFLSNVGLRRGRFHYNAEAKWASRVIQAHNQNNYLVDLSRNKLVALAMCVTRCMLCDSELDYAQGVGHKSAQNTPSLDVIDGSHHLKPENVCIICKRCNIMKSNYSIDEFISECALVTSKKVTLSELADTVTTLDIPLGDKDD